MTKEIEVEGQVQRFAEGEELTKLKTEKSRADLLVILLSGLHTETQSLTYNISYPKCIGGQGRVIFQVSVELFNQLCICIFFHCIPDLFLSQYITAS